MPLFPRHAVLAEQARLPRNAAEISAVDWVILGLCGFLAALLGLSDWDIIKGVPGHAILRAVMPLGLGMMLVPRRGAGAAMGIVACLTAPFFVGLGDLKGAGSLTSVVVLGPLLDLSLLPVRKGRGAYLAFMAAGLLSNLAALVAQGIVKYQWPRGRQPVEVWLLTASWSYPLFGLLAGLIAAIICFRWNETDTKPRQP